MLPAIIEVAELASTNDWLAERAGAGAADGLWVRAGRQTAGRGRRGRAWISELGNLFLSTLARPRAGEGPSQQLSFVAALALDCALQGWVAADRLRLKWPNDLLLEGAKVAGILLEAAPGGGAIIGFGVNLTSSPPEVEQRATSISAAGTVPPAPAVLAAELAGQFAALREGWRQQGFRHIRERWRRRSAHRAGAPLLVQLGRETISGRYEDLDEDGALVLRGNDGARRTIHAGEVFGLEPAA